MKADVVVGGVPPVVPPERSPSTIAREAVHARAAEMMKAAPTLHGVARQDLRSPPGSAASRQNHTTGRAAGNGALVEMSNPLLAAKQAAEVCAAACHSADFFYAYVGLCLCLCVRMRACICTRDCVRARGCAPVYFVRLILFCCACACVLACAYLRVCVCACLCMCVCIYVCVCACGITSNCFSMIFADKGPRFLRFEPKTPRPAPHFRTDPGIITTCVNGRRARQCQVDRTRMFARA